MPVIENLNLDDLVDNLWLFTGVMMGMLVLFVLWKAFRAPRQTRMVVAESKAVVEPKIETPLAQIEIRYERVQLEPPVKVIGQGTARPEHFPADVRARLSDWLHYPLGEYHLTTLQVEGDWVWILHRSGSEWVEVIAPHRGGREKVSYGQFGYSITETRWSYQTGPKNAKLIKDWFRLRIQQKAVQGI